MNQIGVGDYVLFKYNGARMTGLVKEVLAEDDSVKYQIVPSAIGLDYFPIVNSDQIKKISASGNITKNAEWQFQ